MCCALHPCVSRRCSLVSSPMTCSGGSSYGSIAADGGVQRRSFDPFLVASDCSAASSYLYIIASAPEYWVKSGRRGHPLLWHPQAPVQFVRCANEIQSLAVWCGSCACAVWAWTDIERWGNNKKGDKVNSASGMPPLTLPLDLFLLSDSPGHRQLPKQYTFILSAPATATLQFLSFTFLFTY
ncbi:uncharacterized protein LOC119336078 [Triticum dicoccoides]|uniref:uncharacterized protein LOC119336078 n=1 Tax=Triticum dicoccoides TaxID=85692 RepID=UPI000E79A112|nr:uncharacterized protein LOC119336078 [Triticum dicoccoides]